MPRKRTAQVVSAVATGLILAATLPPSFAPAGDLARPCLFLCGEQGMADFLVNIALYVPLGVGLALWGWRPRTLILSAFLLSAAIETLQIVLPGRDSSAGDLVANTLGAALGLGLTRWAPQWLHPSDRSATRWSAAWATGVMAVLAATGWLVQPGFPTGAWYGQWTPRFGHLEHYGGEVVSARLGPLEVPSWRHPRSDSVRSLLRQGAPLEVVVVAGPPPSALAPIFSIADDRQRTMLMIGADGADLRLGLRRRAYGLRLDAPDLRLRDWMSGVAAGDTVTLHTWRTGDGICLRLDDRRECELGMSPARGWAVLYWLPWAPDWLLRTLDVLWVAALFGPLGLWMRRSSAWALSVGAALAALIAAPALTGLQPSGFVEFVGVAVGLEAGLLARREARRRW